jgi:hypothetical protein
VFGGSLRHLCVQHQFLVLTTLSHLVICVVGNNFWLHLNLNNLALMLQSLIHHLLAGEWVVIPVYPFSGPLEFHMFSLGISEGLTLPTLVLHFFLIIGDRWLHLLAHISIKLDLFCLFVHIVVIILIVVLHCIVISQAIID